MSGSIVAAVLAGVATAIVLGLLMPGSSQRTLTTSAGSASRRWSNPRWFARRASMVVLPAELASWTDDLARAMRRGTTLHAALTAEIPDDPALRTHTEPLRHWLARGATVTDACDEWADALALSSAPRVEMLASLAAVLAAASILGGNTAEPLDRFASAMRERLAVDLERAAHSAQAQMSARVLTVLPLGVLMLLIVTDADVRHVLTTSHGTVVVAAGVSLNAAGAWWMHRIVRTAGAAV